MTKYVAEVSPVREVALIGTVDLSYWSEQLRPYGLHAMSRDGHAEIQIGAMSARFRGVRFREFIFALKTCNEPQCTTPDSVFFPQAFSTPRVFSFIERVCFHTPYLWGKNEFEVNPPLSMRLSSGGETLFNAAMASDGGEQRTPIRTESESWEGPIYLPRTKGKRFRKFHARFSGSTQTFAFDASRDDLEFQTSNRAEIF